MGSCGVRPGKCATRFFSSACFRVSSSTREGGTCHRGGLRGAHWHTHWHWQEAWQDRQEVVRVTNRTHSRPTRAGRGAQRRQSAETTTRTTYPHDPSRVPGWDVMASVGGLSEGGSKRLLSVYVTVPPCRVLRYPLQVIGGNHDRLPLLTMIHSS